MRKLTQTLALLVLTLSLLLGGCAQPAPGPSGSQSGSTSTASETAASLDDIPAFSGEPYVVIDDNQPSFTASELTTSSFESYAPLDSRPDGSRQSMTLSTESTCTTAVISSAGS